MNDKGVSEGSQSCLKIMWGLSEWMDVEGGVHEGSVLSPLLFIVAMDGIQRNGCNDYESLMLKRE